MRRSLMIMVAAAASVVCGTPAAYASAGAAHSAPAPAVSGSWGTAQVVHGTAALNTQGRAATTSVSCPSTGNCVVAGTYSTLIKGHVHTRPFVDTQTNGTWHTAKQVPGMTALGRVGTVTDVQSLSCASAGNCVVAGYYDVGPFDSGTESFVASETDGTWGAAQEISGFPANSVAEVQSVSCGAPGDCSAGGTYAPSGGGPAQAFVVSETGGTWGAAEEVPGTAALNTGASAQVASVSCSSAGNCSAGGDYSTTTPTGEAFVVKQTGGTWGTAKEVPGLVTINTGGEAQLRSLSCASAGNCTAGGYYTDKSTQLYEPFVVNQTHGTWGTAQEIPGITTLNPGGDTALAQVSCGAAGDCSAVGSYQSADVDGQGYVVSETGGTWGAAENVPGTGAGSSADSVSCTSATRCLAGGSNPDGSGNLQANIASRT